jgi:PTS system cellobiose-specific IIB component
MKKIRLFCSAGMSTSLIVTRMQTEAAKQGLDYDIAAYSIQQEADEGPSADCILLGPQVRFNLNQVKQMFPDKPIDVIDMRSYGLMDAKAILEQAKRLMGE